MSTRKTWSPGKDHYGLVKITCTLRYPESQLSTRDLLSKVYTILTQIQKIALFAEESYFNSFKIWVKYNYQKDFNKKP